MVHALFSFNSVRDVEQLTGYEEKVEAEGETFDTSEWNPLLYTIALGHNEILEYFIDHSKSSLKQAGTFPNGSSKVEDELFSLKLAMKFNSYDSFKTLWNQFLCWDVLHLEVLTEFCIQEKDDMALNAIFDSYTADLIFSSMSPDH